MDFLNPTKKRAHTIQLIIGYILIAIAIGLVTLILVFQSYGYDLDRKTGSIIQNGLLFIAAQPQPADVFLNGRQYESKSDARLVLPSDVYKIQLQREGYRTWTHTISLAGGSIARYIYPFLFPNTLTAKEQKAYSAVPSLATQSPDHHWLIIQEPGQLSVFDQFDAGDSQKAMTTITLPTDLLTASGNHQLTVVEWSTDNRHLLVRHDYAEGREFVVIDRETPASSYNVNKVFKATPSEAAFLDKHFDQLYLYDQAAHKLDNADQRDGSIKPVLGNVLGFKLHGSDMMLYATSDQATAGKARIMIKDNSGSYFLREVPTDQLYLLDLAQYSSHWYVAVGASADGRVYVYKDPLDVIKKPATPTTVAVPETVLRADNPGWIDFSANGQLLAIQGGSQFSVYDAETQHTYRYDLKLPIDGASPHTHWMDGSRLVLNSDSKVVVVDYDGTNQQTLVANQPGLEPFFDKQYHLLYTIAPSAATPGGYALERYNLVVGQNN